MMTSTVSANIVQTKMWQMKDSLHKKMRKWKSYSCNAYLFDDATKNCGVFRLQMEGYASPNGSENASSIIRVNPAQSFCKLAFLTFFKDQLNQLKMFNILIKSFWWDCSTCLFETK